MNKLGAFTIIEMLIVMIITAIMVVAGYFAYNSSLQRFLLFRSGISEGISVAQINLLLKKDFFESTSASMSTAKILTFEKDNLYITYRFDNKQAIRTEALRIDTFTFETENISWEPLEEDPFYITLFTIKSNDVVFNYQKEYDAYFFINSKNE